MIKSHQTRIMSRTKESVTKEEAGFETHVVERGHSYNVTSCHLVAAHYVSDNKQKWARYTTNCVVQHPASLQIKRILIRLPPLPMGTVRASRVIPRWWWVVVPRLYEWPRECRHFVFPLQLNVSFTCWRFYESTLGSSNRRWSTSVSLFVVVFVCLREEVKLTFVTKNLRDNKTFYFYLCFEVYKQSS